MKEQIVDIEGYMGMYRVTNTGKVFSLPNISRTGVRELKQEVVRKKHTNYRRVTLCKNGKTKRYAVHQLVGKAFIPNPGNKPNINHLDNNGENNNDWNLEWYTHSENMIHAQKQGRLFSAQSKGGKNTGKIRKRSLDRLEKLLGSGLVSVSIKEKNGIRRKMAKYRCKYCNNIFIKRADSRIIQRGGICSDCFRDKEIVWTT